MWRAINDLEQLADNQLFRKLSEGMPHIVDNATNLDRAARCLFRNGEFHASEIMRGFAEEEAGKFLVLIDYVRCPRDQEQRAEVLKRSYDHVAKRIHAKVCSYPNIWSFGKLSEFVERERRFSYLDGPNDVDWIFPNSIAADREQGLYVDYVKDITNDPAGGDYYWTVPSDSSHWSSQYTTSDCVKLSKALSEAGATSADSLKEIADIWRGFMPETDTGRRQLRNLIVHTLERLPRRKHALDELIVKFIVLHWPFPMWRFPILPLPNDNPEYLREERQRTIQRNEEIESNRDPAPAISRSKVEELDTAHAAWKREVDARVANCAAEERAGLRIRSSTDIAKDLQLPSYAYLQAMFRELTGEERTTLLALGWYTRGTVADWPRIYKLAAEREPTLDEQYQIGCGNDWLDGLNLWEEEPQPFHAGRQRRFHRH